MLWDLNDDKHLYTLDHNETINALCFSPNRFWLCAAVGPSIHIWDLETKNIVDKLQPDMTGQVRYDCWLPKCFIAIVGRFDYQAKVHTCFLKHSEIVRRVIIIYMNEQIGQWYFSWTSHIWTKHKPVFACFLVLNNFAISFPLLIAAICYICTRNGWACN